MDFEKVKVIYNWKPPYMVKGIQSFFGFYNFYYWFVHDYRVIVKPLIQLTWNDILFAFNSNCKKVFKELKDWLISSLILCYYDLDLELILETDAFDRVIAKILLQLYLDGEWYPVAFFLKIIVLAKCNYKVYNKEMLIIV